MIKKIQDKVKFTNNIKLSVHCHNDLGLALANTIAAIEAGVDQVECTVMGIGERAGNTSTGSLIDILKLKKDKFNIFTGINEDKYYQAVSMLLNITGTHNY